jgi:sorbitol-specific phosphotransferase system component IIA
MEMSKKRNVAYGKFVRDGKEYCLRLSEQAKSENIQVGDTVIAKTKDGNKTVLHIVRFGRIVRQNAKKRGVIICKNAPMPFLTGAELEAKIREIKILTGQLKMVKVAYAKHTTDGKEYCWRLSEQAISDNLQPGDTAVAQTRLSDDELVLITMLGELDEETAGKHRFILRKHEPAHFLTQQESWEKRQLKKAASENNQRQPGSEQATE